jgi:hypothetical protein
MDAIVTIKEVAERMRCQHRTVCRATRSVKREAALIGGQRLVREKASSTEPVDVMRSKSVITIVQGPDVPGIDV